MQLEVSQKNGSKSKETIFRIPEEPILDQIIDLVRQYRLTELKMDTVGWGKKTSDLQKEYQRLGMLKKELYRLIDIIDGRELTEQNPDCA